MLYNRIMKIAMVLFANFALFASLSVLPCAAGTQDGLRFQNEAELEGIKLILPLLSGARENPHKPLEVLRYTLSNGAQKWTEDRIKAVDLWAESQFVAAWVDNRGNVMTLARMMKMMPSALVGTEVTQELFQTAIEDETLNIGPDQDESALSGWMSDYCGIRVAGVPRTLRINTSRLAKLLQFDMGDPRIRAYAFRLNPQYPGQAKAAHNWFAIVLDLANAPDSDTDRVIGDELLAEIKASSMFEGTRARPVANNRTKNKALVVRDDEVRTRARRSIEFMSDWWYMDSPNYIMLSDNDSAEQVAQKLLDELERMRPFYAAGVPKFASAEDSVGVLRLFGSEGDFLSYISDANLGLAPSQTGGIFSGSRRELVIRPTSKITSEQEGSVRNIIKHEGFHQFVFTAFGGVSPSVWFNEGFAGFYENSEVSSGGRLEVNESERHSRTLENLIKKDAVDWENVLPAFLKIGHAQFYADPDVNYAVAYGLVYYLMRGAPTERNKPYADVLAVYRAELERSKDADQATEVAFGEVDMKKFCGDFVSFWSTSRNRQNAKRKTGL